MRVKNADPSLQSDVPCDSYGVLLEDKHESDVDELAEQIRRLGYAVVDSGLADDALASISASFDDARSRYISEHGEDWLRSLDEVYTIRAPLSFGNPDFLRLATNPNLISILRKLILGDFILNQQNGVINPAGETYNQGSWHRDLPYQHFVSNISLAINALFCVDEFTKDNGATFVLPASHRAANFPSAKYIKRNAFQIEAKPGQYILLDCMLFHSGGFNRTEKDRRAVNHVFTIPYFKQQIKLPAVLNGAALNASEKKLFGYGVQEPLSVSQFLNGRIR